VAKDIRRKRGLFLLRQFKEGTIEGVIIKPLERYNDERGWLTEIFRADEIDTSLTPVMSYVSLTHPGAIRGPHAHTHQKDYFCFLGPSNFKIILWDSRRESPTYGNRMTMIAGEDNPSAVIITEGVVHGYQNVGDKDGLVINLPNRLYKGQGKKEPVDEIRYEDDPNSPFRFE
jgi:dTDP-4-dehydrorhamnose 3,5-epimerase